MKPKQPGPDTYTPRSSSNVEFQPKWRVVRVNPDYITSDFPFQLPDLVEDRYPVPFLEFRALCDPPSDIGNPGDIWMNVSPTSYALFALNANKDWVRWPGATLDKARLVLHPYLPLYALWCTIKQASWYHCDKLKTDWTDRKLSARQELGGYAVAASMRDPSVGVRLVLLHEQMEANKASEGPVPECSSTSGQLSVSDQLKAAASELAVFPDMKDAALSTLAAGIDYLLAERQQMTKVLAAMESRAEDAEKKLKATERKLAELSKSIPRPDRHHVLQQTQSAGAETAVCTPSPGARSPNPRKQPRPEPPILPAEPKRAQSWVPAAARRDAVMPSSTSAPPGYTPPEITAKHLEILYWAPEGSEGSGNSRYCRICRACVTHNALDGLRALTAHALEQHAAQCSVLARADEEQLEGALRRVEGEGEPDIVMND
ncbi:hypothetical protein B0H11DRAFT_576360 [Mycena galericulata]|nr:hypothetical protein B0H11DRAFT_576360 [Mycena galericulata]